MSRGYQDKIGLGMYTVHGAVQKNMRDAFIRLSEMGCRGIEFYGEPKDYSAEQVCHALQESGLKLTGWHVEWRNLQEDTFGDTVNYLHTVGCPIAVVPCLGGKWNVGHDSREECRDRWLYYIESLNGINEHLDREGIRLAYHNHEHEFQLRYDGQSVFDLLFENLAPGVILELDSGNCIEGGGNPLSVLQKYKEREILLHLKPYSHEKKFDVVLGDNEDANNWQEILHSSVADYGIDFQWLLIESENRALSEMENARLCIENLLKQL